MRTPRSYFEYVARDLEADVAGVQAAARGRAGAGWHFGSNLVFEHETGRRARERVRAHDGPLARDHRQKLSLGAEMKAAATDVHEDRGDYENRSRSARPCAGAAQRAHAHRPRAGLIGTRERRAGRREIFLVHRLRLLSLSAARPTRRAAASFRGDPGRGKALAFIPAFTWVGRGGGRHAAVRPSPARPGRQSARVSDEPRDEPCDQGQDHQGADATNPLVEWTMARGGLTAASCTASARSPACAAFSKRELPAGRGFSSSS
jgi:hypothetical protein